ncbi:TRAP transporter small permease [Thalassospira marina]|uniref:TRAP transporter small permease protein n=1 Tax=Thalassospira marina TaxID=2048283 RepID=A0ABM6QGD9_9PROT|nr:TRAP transporter small permease [Thalassospira marina]AUG55664.1 TRAP transporter permease DctQ [Thalassospira marina]
MNDLSHDQKIAEEITSQIDAQQTEISDISWWDTPVFMVFWALVLVVFLQFFSRYALNSSIPWTEEVARYLLIVVTFSGAVICARKKSQIYLDFFHLYIPKVASRALFFLMDMITAAFFAYAAWSGASLAQRMGHQRMISIDMQRGYLFWTIVVCLAIAAIVTFARGIHDLRRHPS